MEYLADTVFLIDLWREKVKGGPAIRFAATHEGDSVCICWVVEGEFLSGALQAGHDSADVQGFVSRYPVVHSTPAIVERYARICADMRRAGTPPVGANDLWIAAVAMDRGVPLLSRNASEFSRIPNLKLVDYAR